MPRTLLRFLPAALLLALLFLGFGAARPSPIDAGADASLQGDVNCSTAVDSLDSLQVLRGVAGLSTNAKCLAAAGDTDCDADADSTDALRILRFVASLPVTTPDGCVPIGDPLALPPTSEALIAAALDAGDITYEDSLRERAYAIYADPRQDPRFVSPVVDWEAASELMREVDENESDLSPALLATLAPFRARPNDPVSIFNNLPAREGVASQAAPGWRSLPAPATNARVWVQANSDADLAPFVDAVTNAWSGLGPSPGEVALLRYPNPDAQQVPSPEINPDSKIDFYFPDRSTIDPRSALCAINPQDCTLASQDAGGLALRTSEFVGNTSSAYLMVDRNLSQDRLIATAAHELAHASQFSYDNGETSWLYESTATWAEYKVMKRLQRTPRDPYDWLNTYFPTLNQPMTSTDKTHKYGSWLFFLFASIEQGDGVVNSVWQHASSPGADGITAVDDAFDLDSNFGEFSVRNWNKDPVPQPDLYATEDNTFPGGLHPLTIDFQNSGPNHYPLDEPVPWLAAQYYHLKFDSTVQKVTVENFLNGVPYAHVWVMKQIDFSWQPPEDWTSETKKTFCRDVPDEDLTELVVIVSNAHPTNSLPFSTHVDVDSTGSCVGWKGTLTMTQHTSGGGYDGTITNTANVLFEPYDNSGANGKIRYPCTLGGKYDCYLYFPTGTIEWTLDATWDVGDFHCAENKSGSYPANNIIVYYDQELELLDDGQGGFQYYGNGLDPVDYISLGCTYSGNFLNPVNYFTAPESENYHISQSATTIIGSYHFESHVEDVRTWDWQWDLHKVGNATP